MAEVPVSVDSLNIGDCFVLDGGYDLFQWNGSGASTLEKSKALSVTLSIKNELRKGKAMIYVLDDVDRSSEDAKQFYSLLGVKDLSTLKISSDIKKDTQKIFGESSIFKVTYITYCILYTFL